ncbi:S-layer homology domain-containing protein [Paenibacillus beijingensis]|uniref:SLH domain-containing protein n=1 Tax=Paenibacillus beijingensis TaxID=1126833 RepID=A0A0D5NPP1_9BACL|nr:S-layer homology domain-containing protein [Paenibacillus beijingensis]AJY77115.1 hypothetical protein VN24_24420 [Paenibacillus beijingensis]
MTQFSSGYKTFVWVLAFSLLTGGGAASAAQSGTNTSAAAGTAAPADGGSAIASFANDAGTADASGAPEPIVFGDVKAGHWAEKAITKLSLQKIIIGNNGLFRPSAGVTQEEAVLMALRFIGKDKTVDNSQEVIFPESFVVDNYYKKYVALAFQLGLLDQTDEYGAAAADAVNAWGRKTASREWMTKLIVRSVGKTDAAASAAGQPSSFADAGKIGIGYVGYINAAVSLGLVTGVTAQTFEPQASVTRAAAATLFSRAEAYVPVTFAGQTDGVLTAVSGDKVTVYTGGESRTFTLSKAAKSYQPGSDKTVTADKLTLYTNIRLIGSGTTAYYAEQLDSAPQVKQLEGTVSKIVPSEKKIWLWVGNDPISIFYDESLSVKDSSGAPLAFSSLTVDSSVVVTQDSFRSTPVTLSVEVKSAPVNTSGEAKVASVDAAAGTVTFGEGDKQQTWSVSADAVLTGWDGRVLGNLSGLQAGDTIAYKIQNSKLVSASVKAAAARTVSGAFYGKDSSTITYLVNGSPETKFLSDSVMVTIGGMNNATLDDLYKEDSLQLTVDDTGKVTAVTVTGRKVGTLAGAQIIGYETGTKVLTVKGTDGTLLALQLTDKTALDFNGTTLPLAAAGSLLAQGHRISVAYNGTDAIAIHFVHQYTGTVTALSTATGKLTMQLEDGSSVTLSLSSPTVEWQGKTGAAVTDIKAGTRITAMLDSNQEKANVLKVFQPVQYTIGSVDTQAKKIRLQGADGKVTEFSTSDMKLQDDGGAAVALSALKQGGTVNVTFAGTTPATLTTVTVTAGRINSLSTGAVSLDIYGGGSTTIQLGTGYSIIKNGSVSSSAAVLAPGDRAEVKKNAEGAVVVTVSAGTARTFWRYDAALNQIITKRKNISDTDYTYQLTTSTLITRSGAAVSVSDLREGDALVIYKLNGAIVEVAKQ